MAAVTKLVTLVDVNDQVEDAHQMSVSARHEAELVDGRRVLLLDDRGWTSTTLRATWGGEVPGGHVQREPLDPWALISVEEIEETARVVVGPDEPVEGHSQEDAEADHWAYLAGVLRQQGVVLDAVDLKRLPHEVVLSERLLARLGRGQGGTVSP